MEEQNIASCHPVLLTGSTTARQKREIYQKIADGEPLGGRTRAEDDFEAYEDEDDDFLS